MIVRLLWGGFLFGVIVSGFLVDEAVTAEESLRVACDPGLQKLVRRWEHSSGIPIEAVSVPSTSALRQVAARKVECALVLGEISQGERSLLSVRTNDSPVLLTVGWEVPRFLVHSKTASVDSLSWTAFLETLKGATAETAVPSPWAAARNRLDLCRRFLPADQRATEAIPGLRTLPLEAEVLGKVLRGEVEMGLVFSRNLSNSETKTLAIEGKGEKFLPEPEIVREGKYPPAAKIRLISCQSLTTGEPVSRLARFVLGATGQAVLEKAGFLPVERRNLSLPLTGGVTSVHR